MPIDLVLVRHGQTEGNLARERSKREDKSLWTAEFRERPGRLWRLTDLGIGQAQAAGAWIRENLDPRFSRYTPRSTPGPRRRPATWVCPAPSGRRSSTCVSACGGRWRTCPRTSAGSSTSTS